MTSAVFFDLDETLVDSDSARDAAVRAMVDGDDVVDLWRNLEDKYFDAYLAGDISMPSSVAAASPTFTLP